MMAYSTKGIVADKTYVMLNGATAITGILHYTQTFKDASGKKIKVKFPYFVLEFGEYSRIQFEELRYDKKPYVDSDGHTYVVFVNDDLNKVREKIISICKK